jgi:hypothetical protein
MSEDLTIKMVIGVTACLPAVAFHLALSSFWRACAFAGTTSCAVVFLLLWLAPGSQWMQAGAGAVMCAPVFFSVAVIFGAMTRLVRMAVAGKSSPALSRGAAGESREMGRN